jgi:hypothetical protein
VACENFNDLLAFLAMARERSFTKAKDAQAAAFYRHHGFVAFNDNQLALFLPLATAQELLERR